MFICSQKNKEQNQSSYSHASTMNAKEVFIQTHISYALLKKFHLNPILRIGKKLIVVNMELHHINRITFLIRLWPLLLKSFLFFTAAI